MKSTRHYISTLIHDLRDYLDEQTTFDIEVPYQNGSPYFNAEIVEG